MRAREFVRVFHLEDGIRDLAGDYIAYLDLLNINRQRQVWSEAWNSMLAEVKASGATHIFATLHATYFRKNRFFSVANIGALREFAPDVVVTLIDDAHECWYRIQVREATQKRGTNVRLRDVLLWRTVEIRAGDFIFAEPTRHFVVAAKHPTEMVRRLLFQTHQRIYASFPISAARGDSEMVAAVDGFRSILHEHYAVFDPLTIDELRLSTALDVAEEADNFVTVEASTGWPLTYPKGFEPMAPSEDIAYPIKIPKDQAREATEDIDRQIEARDFRLIEQVQAVAAYRPNMNQHHSRGVNAELLYAAQAIGIPVHLVWDEAHDGPFGTSPFSANGVPHDDIAGLIQALG